jgi:hypothetical protein
VDETAERQHLLHLAALQIADEVPLEGVAPAFVLGGEVLLAVLPDQVHTRLGKGAHLLQRYILGGDEDLDLASNGFPHALEVRPHLLRFDAVDQPRHSGLLDPDQPGLATGATGVATVGEEQLRVAAGAELGALDPLDPRFT